MSDDTMVQVEGLTHCYGAKIVLDDVSFAVERASLFALLGPNGGGKTTLFNILATILVPTGGRAAIGGADLKTARSQVRGKIGIVFQTPSLDGKLSVYENLRHQGHLYGMSGGELRARAGELLARFGLTDRARDRVETLSGGLKRRVELSKSLLHRPEVLILDEPSTGLDPTARLNLINHLTELGERDGVTVLLTTHLMDEADRCDRVAIIDHGKLVGLDTPMSLKAMIGGDVLTIRTADPAAMAEKLREEFGTQAEVVNASVRIEVERGHELVSQLVETFANDIHSITVGKPTLEDVFVHLTGHRLKNGAYNGPRAEES